MLLSFSWAVTAACSYSRTERKHDTAQEQRASALSTSFGLVVLPRFVLEFWRASLSSREPTCNPDRKQPRGTLQLRTRYSLLPFRVQFPVSSLYVIVCLYATSSMQQGSHSFSHACQRPAPNTQQSWEEMELADGWVHRTCDSTRSSLLLAFIFVSEQTWCRSTMNTVRHTLNDAAQTVCPLSRHRVPSVLLPCRPFLFLFLVSLWWCDADRMKDAFWEVQCPRLHWAEPFPRWVTFAPSCVKRNPSSWCPLRRTLKCEELGRD